MAMVNPEQLIFEKLDGRHVEIIRSFKNQEIDLLNFLIEDASKNQAAKS